MGAGISIAVNGKHTDLSEVTWCMVAPCGCVSGLTVGYSNYGNRPPRAVVTAEQAEQEFNETEALRKKYRRLGFTYRPELLERSRELFAKCEHDPKYGYSIPGREGKVWAVGGYHGRRTSVLHLVTEDCAADKEGVGGYAPATALCGQSQHHWTREWHLTDGRVECTRCIKAATS